MAAPELAQLIAAAHGVALPLAIHTAGGGVTPARMHSELGPHNAKFHSSNSFRQNIYVSLFP